MKKQFLSLQSLLFLVACSGPHPQSIIDTYQAGRELKNNRPALAQDRYVMAITRDPFLFETNLNLGFSFENKDQDKNSGPKKEMSPELELAYNNAVKSYLKALELAKTDEQKFIARFNLGEVYGRLKNIPKALEHYQEALNVLPKSNETKTNIELLLQKQSGQGQGKGESDNKDDKNKDQNKDGKGEGSDQKKDQNDKKNDNQGDKKDNSSDDKNKDQKDSDKDSKEKDKENKGYGNSAKYKPRPFKGELPESELKKILNELKQQDQKIRAEYNRKEVKEAPRDKDW